MCILYSLHLTLKLTPTLKTNTCEMPPLPLTALTKPHWCTGFRVIALYDTTLVDAYTLRNVKVKLEIHSEGREVILPLSIAGFPSLNQTLLQVVFYN